MVSLGTGTVIGPNVFSSVGEAATASGCAAIMILAFIVGRIIIIPQNMVAVETITAYPDNGGFYVWFRETRSRPLAFLCSQTTFWSRDPPLYSIMTLVLADYIVFSISGTTRIGIKLLTTALIVTFMIINMRSVEVGGRFLTLMTSFEMLLSVFLIGMGLFYADKAMISAPATTGASTGSKMLSADVPVIAWSYTGTATTCSMTGKVKDPEKTIPEALIITVFIIIVIYTSLVATVTDFLPINLLTAFSTPVVKTATQIPVIGLAAGVMTAFIVIIATIASLHGTIMYQPRIGYTIVKDGLFFRKFAEIHPEWETSTNSIMYSCAVSIVLAFIANIGALLEFFSFVALRKNTLSFVIILKLHKKADYNPSWKCPAWPLMAVLSVGASVVILVSTFLWAPYKNLFNAFVVVVAGLPTYYFWESRNGKEGRA